MSQVQGLVDGGVHLLMLDMVSDTLNAKAHSRFCTAVETEKAQTGVTGDWDSIECIEERLVSQCVSFAVLREGSHLRHRGALLYESKRPAASYHQRRHEGSETVV